MTKLLGDQARTAQAMVAAAAGLYYSLCALLAVSYGAVLASLPVGAFKDRENYLVYAQDSLTILGRHWESGPLAGMVNEPLWLLINSTLSVWLSPEWVLRVLIFVPAASVAWIVLRRGPQHFIWLLLILFVPQVMKNYVVHLRQGVAIALFLGGWFSSNRSARWLCLAATPFIHASFFFILAMVALTRVARLIRLGADLRIVLFAAAGAVIGGGLGWLAHVFGARQAQEYSFTAADVSGLGFVLWSVVLAVICLQGASFIRRYTFEIGVIAFYLGTYFLVEVTARVFESGLILVLLAGFDLTSWRRQAFLALVLFYVSFQWVLRVGQPWMGFGLT